MGCLQCDPTILHFHLYKDGRYDLLLIIAIETVDLGISTTNSLENVYYNLCLLKQNGIFSRTTLLAQLWSKGELRPLHNTNHRNGHTWRDISHRQSYSLPPYWSKQVIAAKGRERETEIESRITSNGWLEK